MSLRRWDFWMTHRLGDTEILPHRLATVECADTTNLGSWGQPTHLSTRWSYYSAVSPRCHSNFDTASNKTIYVLIAMKSIIPKRELLSAECWVLSYLRCLVFRQNKNNVTSQVRLRVAYQRSNSTPIPKSNRSMLPGDCLILFSSSLAVRSEATAYSCRHRKLKILGTKFAIELPQPRYRHSHDSDSGPWSLNILLSYLPALKGLNPTTSIDLRWVIPRFWEGYTYLVYSLAQCQESEGVWYLRHYALGARGPLPCSFREFGLS